MIPAAPRSHGAEETASAVGIDADIASILTACAHATLDEKITVLTHVDERLRQALDSGTTQ